MNILNMREDMCKVFGLPKLRTKAKFCAISSTSGTATEVTAFSIITDYKKGIKYPIADFEITPDVAIVDFFERLGDGFERAFRYAGF